MSRSTRPTLPVAFALLLSLPLAAGCAKEGSAQPEEASSGAHAAAAEEDLSQATLVPNTEARPGDVTRCPISGKPFRVTEASPRMEYEGKTYVFCCDRCLNKFKADPAAGVAKLATFEGSASDEGQDAVDPGEPESGEDDAAAETASPQE